MISNEFLIFYSRKMKSRTCALILSFLFLASQSCAEKSCSKIPTIKLGECCKMPEFAESKVVSEVVAAVQKEEGSDYLKICKIMEGIFKKLNLVKNDEVDKEASIKYLDNQITDSDWKPVAKQAFEFCVKEMEPHYEEIQKRSNFTKAQCNIKYDALVECIDFAAFEACPKKSWTEKTECSEAKKFITDCHKDFQAMNKFSNNQQ